jgi:hypothetical protein
LFLDSSKLIVIQIAYKVSILASVLVVLLGVNFQLEAAEEANPFLAINKRNAFDLANEPPSRKSEPPPAEPAKSEDIKLTGIYRHRGIERAALAMIDPKKKTEPPKYIELAVGEKQGGIEIVSIDKKTGEITVKEFGSMRSLSFKENTFKTSVSKSPRSSSKSSSSRSSDAKKAAAERRASYERKKREEAEKKKREESSSRSTSYSNFSSAQRAEMRSTYEQLTRGKSEAEKAKIKEQFAAEFRGSSEDSKKGGDKRRSRGR